MEPTYTIGHTTVRQHNMSLDEPLTVEQLIPLIKQILETTDIETLSIKRIEKKKNNTFLIFSKLFNNEVYGLVLRESLFQVPNNTYWPFELIDVDEIPEIHLQNNIKIAQWLWRDIFSREHKKHFEELIKNEILPDDV